MTGLTPVHLEDPVNVAILSISEDRLRGFHRDPIAEIARRAELPAPLVADRIRGLVQAGVVRRVRQTLLTTNLAPGALVAWRFPEDRLQPAFDFMHRADPFTGHVVVRTTHPGAAGEGYRLWTTLKVPQGYSLGRHAAYLARSTGAADCRLMPAKYLFVLGVGHIRRRGLAPGSRSERPVTPQRIEVTRLDELEWRVLNAMKREFSLEEIGPAPWSGRAREAGTPLERFFEVAESLDRRGLIGRFSTFLEHVKPVGDGQRLTRYNALFHWAVPPGRELEAGAEIGRHQVLTHAYWRDAGPEFGGVNLMGVAHGTEREWLLAHKAAIDEHLAQSGIPLLYTNVFWGGRSEIKPSEISPAAYEEWCLSAGLDPASMREAAPGEPGREPAGGQ